MAVVLFAPEAQLNCNCTHPVCHKMLRWDFCQMRINLTLFSVTANMFSLPKLDLIASSHCIEVSHTRSSWCLFFALFIKESNLINMSWFLCRTHKKHVLGRYVHVLHASVRSGVNRLKCKHLYCDAVWLVFNYKGYFHELWGGFSFMFKDDPHENLKGSMLCVFLDLCLQMCSNVHFSHSEWELMFAYCPRHTLKFNLMFSHITALVSEELLVTAFLKENFKWLKYEKNLKSPASPQPCRRDFIMI